MQPLIQITSINARPKADNADKFDYIDSIIDTIIRGLSITYPEGMITALGNTALKIDSICSVTPVNTASERGSDAEVGP